MYHYLVTDKASGQQHLAEASSPSVAIADAAAEKFTAERVDGGVLKLLKKTVPVRRVGKPAEPGTKEPGKEPAEPTDNAEKS